MNKKTFEQSLDEVLNELRTVLLLKNKKYGNSALEPKRVFSKASPTEQLKVRLDDKLSRLMAGTQDNEDTVLDLMGYLVLLKISEGIDNEEVKPLFNDDIVDSFTYFQKPFTEGGIVPDDHDNDDIDYENLLRDDEHEDNIDKVYHTNEPLEGFEVVEGRFYIGNTYIGIGKMTMPIIKVD